MFTQLARLFGYSPTIREAHNIYLAAVAQSRQPVFYTDLEVADTIDGRFDMIVLHVWLLIRRLRQAEEHELAQALIDRLMDDMDSSIREFSVGDSGVAKRLKKMAYAFNGRMHAYNEAIAEEQAMSEALKRNVYRDAEVTPATLNRLTHYVMQSAVVLAAQETPCLSQATLPWPDA